MTRVRAQRRQKPAPFGSFRLLNVLTTLLFTIGVAFILFYSPQTSEHSTDLLSTTTHFVGDDVARKPSRRRFLKYTPSLWEQLWLDNITTWEKERLICKKLKSEAQFHFVRAFMKTTCTFQYEGTPWCTVDDGTGDKRRFWFNLETAKVSRGDPPDLPPSGFKSWSQVFESRKLPVKQFAPEDLESNNKVPMVFSRLDFVDDVSGTHYSEYIEPLVSHLRHPLSACYQQASYTTRAYLIPPPVDSIQDDAKKFYFDAGASRWSSGEGGPSLSFFTEVWKRHGIDFDHIECWEGTTLPEKFYSTVPREYMEKTHYNQEYIASSPNKAEPFVPTVIKSLAKKDDYVLFKLDIDSGDVERGTVEHLLAHPQDLEYIDEFLWEHHVEGNYLMKHAWKNSTDDMSLSESYQYFLRLRQRGVRAHSWV